MVKINRYRNKSRNRYCKTASKIVVQKTVEVIRDLIRNKIADKITSLGKPKETTKKVEEIYIPPEETNY